MSSMIHGIRILDKKDNLLTFKTYLIYSDWQRLPRTHGFGLLILADKAYDHPDCALNQEIKGLNFIDNNYEMARKFISKLELSDFENIIIKDEFLESTWHYLDEKTGRFHAQESLPQAIFKMEVTDPKWIEHLNVGDVWETTSCDLGGASWYMEEVSDKSQKFYRVYCDEMGSWKIHYGKIGTTGRLDTDRYMDFRIAKLKANEKLKKGYQLVYQNFDTDYGIEDQMREDAVKQAKEKALPEGNDAIYKAVEENDIPAIKRLLENGLDPNECKDKYGYPILEDIAKAWRRGKKNNNNLEIARLLLEHGADPNKGLYGPFLPSLCYSAGNEDMIRLLLEFGADIMLSEDGEPSIHYVASGGYLWLLKDLIAKGADVKELSSNNRYSVLHYAAKSEQNAVEMIDILLENGAKLDHFADGEWGTPLFWAAHNGQPDTIKHLLKAGANIDAQTRRGQRAIHQAAQYASFGNFRILVEAGANMDGANNENLEVMEIIMGRLLAFTDDDINQTAMEKIRYLNAKGFEINRPKVISQLMKNVKTKKKLTKNEDKLVLELLDLGLDPYIPDSKGFALIHFFAKINHATFLEKSLEKPGNINLQDENGWSALHYAYCHKDQKCVKILLDAGIDPSLKTRKKYKYLKIEFPSGLTAKEIAVKI